jgi:hypothetical protein
MEVKEGSDPIWLHLVPLTSRIFIGAKILPGASRQSTSREAASLCRYCFTALLFRCLTALLRLAARWLLERGHRFCFLYTDMAKPTSNAIYRRIGYRLACGSAMIAFTAPGEGS